MGRAGQSAISALGPGPIEVACPDGLAVMPKTRWEKERERLDPQSKRTKRASVPGWASTGPRHRPRSPPIQCGPQADLVASGHASAGA